MRVFTVNSEIIMGGLFSQYSIDSNYLALWKNSWKNFFENLFNFENNQKKKHEKLPSIQRF